MKYVLRGRHGKYSVCLRRGKRHDTAVEPEGVQPRVTQLPVRLPAAALYVHTRQHAYQPFNFVFLSAAPCGQSLYHRRWHNADRVNAGSAPFGRPVDDFCVQYACRLSTGWLFCGVDLAACVCEI